MYCGDSCAHRMDLGRGMNVCRCSMNLRRHLGAVLAFGGVMIVFVCLPVEAFLLVLGVSMTAVGVVLLDI